MKISTLVCLTVVLAVSLGTTVPSAVADDAAWQKILEAAKKEGSVNAAASSLSGKAAVTVMNAFKDKYGISLEFIPGRMAVAREKIFMEQKSKNYVTDCMDSGGLNVLRLKQAGFLESVYHDLPVLREKGKFYDPISDDPEKEMLNILKISSFIFVNTNLVKPEEEPKSWYDLLDPKWKGKIYLTNPMYTANPEEVILVMTKYGGLDIDYFVKLYKNSQIGGTGGGDEMMDKLVRGEVAIAGFAPGATGLKPMNAGAPIKVLDLKEGHMAKTMKWGAIKNRPHPNASKVYMNWYLSKEGQEMISKATSLDPIRKDVPSSMPFTLEGPTRVLSYEDLQLAAKRRKENHMANYLGLKRKKKK